MLRATTACKFSSLIWPAGSAPAAFSEPTFRPSGATNQWKNTVFRDFPTFSRICIFFLLTFSLLTLPTSAFQLSILSEVSFLNFLRLLLIIGNTYYLSPFNKGFMPCLQKHSTRTARDVYSWSLGRLRLAKSLKPALVRWENHLTFDYWYPLVI